jgi:hypothetical protein
VYGPKVKLIGYSCPTLKNGEVVGVLTATWEQNLQPSNHQKLVQSLADNFEKKYSAKIDILQKELPVSSYTLLDNILVLFCLVLLAIATSKLIRFFVIVFLIVKKGLSWIVSL